MILRRYITKNVRVEAEANNKPEISVNARPSSVDDAKAIRKKRKEKEAADKAAADEDTQG